jgi:hypothetical protein
MTPTTLCEYCDRLVERPMIIRRRFFCGWRCAKKNQREDYRFQCRMIFGKHSVWTQDISRPALEKLAAAMAGARTPAEHPFRMELADRCNRLPQTSLWGQGRGSVRSFFFCVVSPP